jgi:hypothetical protein
MTSAFMGGVRRAGRRGAERRLTALIAAAWFSGAAALLLVFRLVTPQAIVGLETAELLGLLGLLVLPVVAVWAHRECCINRAGTSNQHMKGAGPVAAHARAEMAPELELRKAA